MSLWEYRLAAAALRIVGWLAGLLPRDQGRVVMATARLPVLEGNLLWIDAAIRRRRPDVRIVHLLEPYSYGLTGKVRYLARLARGMYYLRTSGLVFIDNAWLPVHVAPHRPDTTVVQVWHAPGALKRFGADTPGGLKEPERTFLHRYYDYAIAPGTAAREPWSRALRTPLEQVLALGAPRTDLFFDAPALERARATVTDRHPVLAGRRIVLYAPTFRGRGKGKVPSHALDPVALRAALPDSYALVLKSHPNLDASSLATAGYDVVAAPDSDMNDLLAAADILVTDYSSSVFEWALLRRPLVLLVDDLETYEVDPGLYLDYRTDMVGTQVRSTPEVAATILGDRWDLDAYEPFIKRYLDASDGRASERVVERFVP